MEIVNFLEQNSHISPMDAKGIVGRSPLLALENFNFVIDVPCEYLHSMCLGVCKKLVILTFDVGFKQPRNTKRKLSPISAFNVQILIIKFPFEFARRARSLDFSVLKGQEFRNIGLFFFPLVINCIDDSEPERKIWLLFSFMLRACVIPEKEFQKIPLNVIEDCGVQFYKLYEKVFGVQNCTYNTHVVASHILQIRAHGPLTLTSAFGFENFYGELKNSFVAGTCSPLKQMMQQILLKRTLSYHSCAPPIVYTNHETELECNNLIYTYRLGEYKFYKINDIENDNKIFKCHEIEIAPYVFTDTPDLRWEDVGVFEEQSIHSEIVNVESTLVEGKLVRVQNLLMTCPINILEEK